MNIYNMSERRVTNRLCGYWSSLRNNRNYPSLNEVSEDEICEIWPYCFVVLIENHKDEVLYKVNYMGQFALEAFNAILKTVQEDEIVDNIRTYLEEVVENNEPIVEESEHIDGYDTIKFRQCFLPLSKNNKDINAIIGAVRQTTVPQLD